MDRSKYHMCLLDEAPSREIVLPLFLSGFGGSNYYEYVKIQSNVYFIILTNIIEFTYIVKFEK
jgi:hypothetical protein